MSKAVDNEMAISDVMLLRKFGGKSGDFISNLKREFLGLFLGFYKS